MCHASVGELSGETTPRGKRETEKYIRGQIKEVAKLKPLRMPIFVGSPVRTRR